MIAAEEEAVVFTNEGLCVVATVTVLLDLIRPSSFLHSPDCAAATARNTGAKKTRPQRDRAIVASFYRK